MKKYISLVYLSVFVVASCGGGAQQTSENSLQNASASEIQTDGIITKIGTVSNRSQDSFSPTGEPDGVETSFSASFRKFEGGIPDSAVELLDDMYGPANSQSCSFTTGSFPEHSNERVAAIREYRQRTDEIPQASISAGAELLLSVPENGSYSARPIDDTYTSYQLPEISIEGSVFPKNTVVEILGDEFPAVASAELKVEPWVDFVVSAPEYTATAGTNISWTPPENSENSLVTIALVVLDEGNLFCHVPDNGTFTLPAEAAQIGTIVQIFGVRTNFDYLQVDDALLLTIARVQQLPSYR